jgi:hypothetical protein
MRDYASGLLYIIVRDYPPLQASMKHDSALSSAVPSGQSNAVATTTDASHAVNWRSSETNIPRLKISFHQGGSIYEELLRWWTGVGGVQRRH